MKTSQHTPGPWEVGQGNGEGCIFGPEGTRRDLHVLWPICQIVGQKDHPENIANAEYIVRAVNCHEDLLGACQGALAYLADPPSRFVENRKAAEEAIRAAIAKAEGTGANLT